MPNDFDFNQGDFNAPEPASAAATDLRKALVAYLRSDPDLVGLVGRRIYPGKLPQRARTLPAVCYRVVSDVPGHDLDGADGTSVARIQLDAIAAAEADGIPVALRLRALMDGFRGDLQGLTVRWATKLDEQDLSDFLASGADEIRYHVATDWRIDYLVTIPTF